MRVGARRSSPRVLFSGNANPGGCYEGRVEGERGPECGSGPRRRTHHALGLALGMERRFGGLEKCAVCPGSVRGDAKPGKLLREGIGEGNGMQRSPVNGYIVSHRTEEPAPQRERPVCCCRATGARGSRGAAACVQQLRRSRGEAAGACCPLQPQSVESAKQVQPLRK